MTDSPTDASDPRAVRAAIRAGYAGPTSGFALDYVQANLIVVPAGSAADFADLCARNPVPCPVIERLSPGTYAPACAPDADLRTDLPRYRVYRKGLLLEKRESIVDLWHPDFTAFLIGSSYSFDKALLDAGLDVRHLRLGKTISMYRTSWRLAPAGDLFGHMVVSMRPFKAEDVDRVRDLTRPYRFAHGEPLHWGDPEALGIRRLDYPDEGEAVPVERGEIPVFWGCGVTPQLVAIESRMPYAIVHEPGHMFVTDLSNGEPIEEAAR